MSIASRQDARTRWKPFNPAAAKKDDKVTLESLFEELEALPASRPVSLQVVALVDDPNVSAAKLASMIAADAALTTRLLRLANSPYYGLSGRVSSLQYAVTVLGFYTIRAMALADAAGVNGHEEAPEGFWEEAALLGAASAQAARWTGAQVPEALCAGLLADLGKALLYRADKECYGRLLEEEPNNLLARERELYGIDHAQAAGRVLEMWDLPTELVRAVRTHHEPLGSLSGSLEKSVSLGREFARALQNQDYSMDTIRIASDGKITPDQIQGIVNDLRREAEALASALTSQA